MDKNNSVFWSNLKPGSFVTLNDKQTLEQSIEQSGTLDPIQFKIAKVIEVHEENGLMTWRFFILESDNETLWLCAKIVDENFDLRIYSIPEDFEQGDRQDQLDAENYWLFQEPDDSSDFDIEELLYTTELIRDEGTGDTSKTVTYHQKWQGELNGWVKEIPQPSGIGEMLATVSEYSSEDQESNSEAMLLEIGHPECKTGGMIQLLIGYPISIGEIDPLAI